MLKIQGKRNDFFDSTACTADYEGSIREQRHGRLNKIDIHHPQPLNICLIERGRRWRMKKGL